MNSNYWGLSPNDNPSEIGVNLETISSSSDFSDSEISPPPHPVIHREQRKREILYCFVCEQSIGDNCWSDNHLIFDISDIIRISVGAHFVSYFETVANLDRAFDQRTKYAGVLNTVKISLERLKQNVEEKIAENNSQMAQLMATKQQITTRRDSFFSMRDASGTDRDRFRTYIDECSQSLTAPCASAALLDKLYAPLEQAQFKLTVESETPMDWSNHVNCFFNGPLNILDSLENISQDSTAGDVRRVVAFALATAELTDDRERRIRTSGVGNPLPPQPTTRVNLPLPPIPRSAPPPLRVNDLRRYTTDNFPSIETITSQTVIQESNLATPVDNNIPVRPSSTATTPADSTLPQLIYYQDSNGSQELDVSPVSENEEEIYQEADDVLTIRNRQQNQVRESLTNTCAWHPVNSWLASTTKGSDAVIWILPSQNWKKSDKKKKEGSISASTPNLASSSNTENSRKIPVRLDHSNDAVCQMTWNPKGNYLATGSKAGLVRFWEIESNLTSSRPPEAEPMDENRHDGDVSVLKYSPSGEYLMSGGIDTKIYIWDAERLCLHQTFTFHTASVCDVDWKPDSKTFVSCASDGANVVSCLGQQQPLRSIVDYPRVIKAVRWDSSGDFLASCSVDSTLQVWRKVLENSSSGELNGHNRSVNAISWRPTYSPPSGSSPSKTNSSPEKFLASGSEDGTVIIWDIEANTRINLRSKNKNKSSVKSLAFSPDGKILAAAREDGCLDFWFAKSGKPTTSTKLVNSPIHKIEWDSTGTFVGAAVGQRGAEFVDFSKLVKRSFTLWPFSD